MSPLPTPASVASLERWSTGPGLQRYWTTVLLASLFAAVLRFIVVVLRIRRKRASGSALRPPGSSMEKSESVMNQRRDSSQKEALDLHANQHDSPVFDLKKKDALEPESNDTARRVSPEQIQNNHLASLEQETRDPALVPISPWTAPPQRLPGPYDAPYYPLPLPSIGVEATAANDTQPQSTEIQTRSNERPEHVETTVYSRLLARETAPESERVRASVVTVSTRGWRRSQWTVNAR